MSNGAITFEDLKRMRAMMVEKLLPSALQFYGLDIIESPFSLAKDKPIRVHKRRRNQTAAYHRRIQKKWTKRFGVVSESYAYVINPGAAGMGFLGGPKLVMDKHMLAQLKHRIGPAMPRMNGEPW